MEAADLIVGDVGGTNARLAWARVIDGGVGLEDITIFPSADFADFADILRTFAGDSAVRNACIGVPGPVRDNRCKVTNLPWQLDGQVLGSAVGIEAVRLINDLEAAAYGLDALDGDALTCLHPGQGVAQGNQAVIAPGTGLGEAGRVSIGDGYRAFATEGGHASFAPYDEDSFALRQWLSARHGHVSWERLLSGPGLAAIDGFLAEQLGEPADEREPAAVSEAALAGEARAQQALQWFIRLLGMEASNLALKWMATGGVYLAGGIAPRLAERLLPDLIDAFLDKGRMRAVLERMPVWLVTDPYLALRGAALYSARFREE